MMNWKGWRRKRYRHNLRHCPGIHLDELKKTKKTARELVSRRTLPKPTTVDPLVIQNLKSRGGCMQRSILEWSVTSIQSKRQTFRRVMSDIKVPTFRCSGTDRRRKSLVERGLLANSETLFDTSPVSWTSPRRHRIGPKRQRQTRSTTKTSEL
jgi:hypothetical protein